MATRQVWIIYSGEMTTLVELRSGTLTTTSQTTGLTYNHKLVDLEEAAEAGMDNSSHSGKQTNLFFSGNKTEFSDSTDPNSKTYAGTSSGITIDNISAAGDSMTFDVTF